MRYKYAIFDLDGTLCDTIYDTMNIRNTTYSHFGIREMSYKETREHISFKECDFILAGLPDDVKNNAALVEEIVLYFRNEFAKHFMDVAQPFEKVVDLIKNLKQKGVKLAVLTNKEEWNAKPILERFFPKLFDFVRGYVPGEITKPERKLMEFVLEKLGASKEEFENAVMIGDAHGDILTAQNTGIDCIAVGWGYTDIEKLSSYNPTYIVSSPDEIFDIINK